MRIRMALAGLITSLMIGFVSPANGLNLKTSAAKITKAVQVHPSYLRIVKQRGWSVYNRPLDKRSRPVMNTTQIRNRLVKPVKRISNGHETYELIQRGSRIYGWVNSLSLGTPSRYVLPYQYYSQLYPLWAPEACEATSLKIGLSAKGLANDVGLKYIVDHMPKSSHSNRGFSGNPYKKNSGIFYWWNLIKHGFNGIFSQTIYPKPLAEYARHYDSKARNITGASQSKLIDEIKRGNPVIFVGSFQMIDTNSSYHILTLVGYRPGYFLVADPYRHFGQRHRVFWVRNTRFMKIFNNQLRRKRAVAL